MTTTFSAGAGAANETAAASSESGNLPHGAGGRVIAVGTTVVRSLETVADAARAVKDGRAVSVDRAVIDGQTFVNTASIGNYVDLVDAREKLEDRIGKWPAVVVALVKVLRTSRPVQLELDGERRRVWMIFIGNCRYQPSGFAPSWRERMDDGQLDIRIVDGTRPY